jgi:hypothetical protein
MIRRPYQIAIATMVVSWLILAVTAPGIPLVWDEGQYLHRADYVVRWFRLLIDFGDPRGGLHALSPRVIRDHWLFITYAEGHPAWFAIPIAASRGLLTGAFGELTASRMGPMMVFSAACGMVALVLKRKWGTTAAIAAPVALLTFPRMFSEAHFATQDGQLTAWWLALWAADALLTSSRSVAGVGVVLGLTSATKFTGWLAWIPLLVVRLIRKDGQPLRQLLIVFPVALLTFHVVNPPLWDHPISSLVTHFRLNLDRTHSYNIPMLFFGHRYDMEHSLPWYNTIAWLAIVTPLPTLMLGLVGLAQCLSIRTRTSLALVLNWATLMVVRALPGTPPHDGIRLFLPAFGFWCVLAGIGTQRAWDSVSGSTSAWRQRAVRAAIVTSLLASAVNLARYYPQTLSHYNVLAGGVRGAAALGMEPTYWWDALDNDVLRWINDHTEPGAAVAFARVPDIALLHDWGRLQPKDVDPETEAFKWYVLQNRPGMFDDGDRKLIQRATPAYMKYAGRRSAADPVPADLDVPLILIFSYEQYQQSRGLRPW